MKAEFTALLSDLVSSGWIQEFQVSFGTNIQVGADWSKTHFNDEKQQMITIAVRGPSVGIDGERMWPGAPIGRSAYAKAFIGLPETAAPRDVWEEWAAREAAFKSMAPNNDGVFVDEFERDLKGGLSYGGLLFEIKIFWLGSYVLAFARPSERE